MYPCTAYVVYFSVSIVLIVYTQSEQYMELLKP